MPVLIAAIAIAGGVLAGFWLGIFTSGPWRWSWDKRCKARFTAERWTVAFVIVAFGFVLNYHLAAAGHPQGTLSYVALAIPAGLLLLPDVSELEFSGVKVKRIEQKIREDAGAVGVATERDAALIASAATAPTRMASSPPVGADQWIKDTQALLSQSQPHSHGGQVPPG